MNIQETVIEHLYSFVEAKNSFIIKATTDLRGDLGLDSLEICALAFELEEKLGIIIPDNKLDTITDVKSVVELIEHIIVKSTTDK